MKAVQRTLRKALARFAAGSALIAVCAGAQAAGPAPSQNEHRALQAEVQSLKREVEGMRGELKQIRELLQQRVAQPSAPPAPPTRATATVAGGAALGKEDAPLTLVEFSDYQCPFCRRFSEQTLSALKTQYIDTGKLRYVFRDFPLDAIHPQARSSAEAAHCAGDQGKYWEAHDLLFKNQQQLQPDDLKGYAKTLGLDVDAFNTCLDQSRHRDRVQQNLNDGVKAGVRGTPAFVLGKTGRDGSIEGVFISGARPLESFRQEIEQLLKDK
jgi:protein-disulfide isomerase